MANVERIMAEGNSGPGPEGIRPYFAPDFDTDKMGQYLMREEDTDFSLIDPATGREVARATKVAGGAGLLDPLKRLGDIFKGGNKPADSPDDSENPLGVAGMEIQPTPAGSTEPAAPANQQPDLKDATPAETAGGADLHRDDENREYDGSQENPPKWWPFDPERWKKLDEKDRTVQAAVLVMRHCYNLPDAERSKATNAEMFSAAYNDLAEYALSKKLYDGKDTRIIAVELDLVNFDKKEIPKFSNPAEVVKVLNKLDSLEQEQIGIKAGQKSFGIKPDDPSTQADRLCPPHASREEWQRYLKRPAEIMTALAIEKAKLISLTSMDFVAARKKLKETVVRKVEEIKAIIKSKEEEEKKGGVRADAEPWEKEAQELEKTLEASFLDEEPANLSVPPENEFTSLSVQEILTWKFHKAKELGILDDLEDKLEARYQELALSLLSKSRQDQGDTETEARKGSRNLTLSELREIMAKDLDITNLNSLPNMSELPAHWKHFARLIDSGENIALFYGIRGLFVARAYDQMSDSLSNLYKDFVLQSQLDEGKINQAKFDRFKRLTPERISGEWNVLRYERRVRGQLDAERRAEEDKLFYVDRYYLTLTGTTEAQVEQGVNNYLTSLLEGAHVYDVQTIMQKMQYLSSAIMSKKDVLMQSGMSAQAAHEALTRINILAENRGEFYVMNFSAQNLLMDEYFIPLYDKWAGVIGIEKMKKILDMNDGLVAPAMLLFLDPKNRLLFQPAGFKGQGMKNIWAQRTLRDVIKEQLAEELVNYQAAKTDSVELMEQATWQDFLRKKFTNRTFRFQNNDLKPKEAVEAAKKTYKDKFDRVKVKEADKGGSSTPESLENLRSAREQYTKLQDQYDRLLVQAKSAVETTWQVFNIFGESARLGAPSIIMHNGDHIDIEEATHFYKFAILEAMKKNDDTPARMRWRAYQWATHPWVYDNGKPIIKYKDEKGMEKTITGLVKGLEDTGILQNEFDAFLQAAGKLWTDGYQAVFEGTNEDSAPREYSFEEIVNMNKVRPVRNNFISNYKASREIFANPAAMREAKKGRQPLIMKILERLDQSGRGKFTTLDSDKTRIHGKFLEELPDEKLKELFENAITDSLIFHITARQLARWEATLKSGEFSTDRIYYGSQDIPWGVKRLQYLSEYWMTNKRERIGRAWELLPFIPLLKSSLAQECDAENIADLIFNVNKEHIDEPGLKQIAAGFKDAQGWRHAGETSVDEQKGGTIWSWWDKPSVDIAQLLKAPVKIVPNKTTGTTQVALKDYVNKPELLTTHQLSSDSKKELVDVVRQVLTREAPLSAFLEAQLGYNRSAGGSGIGLEMGERWHYRVLKWWLSEREGSRGMEGGMVVNKDAALLVKLITKEGVWSDGVSILDEAWRQARGTRDAGVSKTSQPPSAVIF